MNEDRDDDEEPSNLETSKSPEDTRALQLGKMFDKTRITEEQLLQLRDTDNFSYEEEFYIFYDPIASTARELIDLQRMVPILAAIGKGDTIADKRDQALGASKLAAWFNEMDSDIPPVPESYVVQPEESLNKDYLEWGRAVRSIIAKEADPHVLFDVWGLRFEELMFSARLDAEMCAKVEASVFKTPESHLVNHLDRCRIDAEESQHRLNVIDALINTWKPEWLAGRAMPEGTLDKAYAEYRKEHSDEMKFLQARKRAAIERINTRMESDPWIQEMKKKAEDSPSFQFIKSGSIEDLMKILSSLGSGEDCDNPDCPIHGTKNNPLPQHGKFDGSRAAAPVRTPPIQQLPRPSQSNEGRNNTMAPDNKKMITKSDDKSNERKFKNVNVLFTDDPNAKHITMPSGMTYEEGRYWLQMMEESETRTFIFEYKFKGWSVLDVMWALYKSAVKLYGFAHVADETHQGFFGSWKTPPRMVNIETSLGNTEQMPWGPIEISGLSQALTPSIRLVDGHPTLIVTAEIKQKEKDIAHRLMAMTEETLSTSSIYRGKAIDMDFEAINPRDFTFDPEKAPKFVDIGSSQINELILPKTIQRLIDVTLWTPIRKTAEARKHKIPLRRTVTMAGPHGVGKTLTAMATARLATENGWTFIYLRKLKQLKEALYFAKKYQPAVVFAEDVDTLVSGERDEEMNEVFNVVDGIDRKDDEVMVVFSTNRLEDIHQGMLRPGRTDTVIPFTPPDADAVDRLLRLYGRGLINDGIDLNLVAKKLAGQIPAIIREVVERSKLAAIADYTDGDLVVQSEHLDAAADQLLVHAKLLQEPEKDKPDLEIFGNALGRVLVQGLRFQGASINEGVKAQATMGLRTIIEDSNLNGRNSLEG